MESVPYHPPKEVFERILHNQNLLIITAIHVLRDANQPSVVDYLNNAMKETGELLDKLAAEGASEPDGLQTHTVPGAKPGSGLE